MYTLRKSLSRDPLSNSHLNIVAMKVIQGLFISEYASLLTDKFIIGIFVFDGVYRGGSGVPTCT